MSKQKEFVPPHEEITSAKKEKKRKHKLDELKARPKKRKEEPVEEE